MEIEKKAIIFDLDGVFALSEQSRFAVLKDILAKNDFVLEDDRRGESLML